MNKKFIIVFLLFFKTVIYGQTTLSWSGYSAGSIGTTYTVGAIPNQMSAVVSAAGVTLGDSSPKYSTSTSPNCYIAAGCLVLNANPFLYGTVNGFTLTITLNTGYNGSCSSASFSIRDINSDESNGTFLDVVTISAIDGNNAAVPAANIVVTPPSNTNVTNVGSSKKIVGHNNSAELYTANSSGPPYSPFFSSACNSTNVVITPPAATPLKSITIVFRPANGGTVSFSCSTCAYFSGTGPTRTANQYISISNIVLNPTVSCTILPIELISFNIKRIADEVKLNWKTASEKNNDYFTIERSVDGLNFEEIKKIKGAGDSYKVLSYDVIDDNPLDELSYYRLKQTDFNGQFKYSDIVSVDVENSRTKISHIIPNPTSSDIGFECYTPIKGELNYNIIDLTGRVLISNTELIDEGNSKINTSLHDLPNGIYFLKVTFDKTNFVSINKVFKN
jgi:hypothetical protein